MDFIKAVDEDAEWDLSWKGRYKKKVKARELWSMIVKNAYDSAEPGFLNWELVESESNISYIEPLVTTNPCVTGDTEILTSEGYKPIMDTVGERTTIWNGFEWSEVTPKITGENQKILKIKFSDGRELKCTPYHKFHISTGYGKNQTKKIEAKDLKLGDKLIKHDFPVIEEGVERNLDEMYTQGFYSADGVKNTKTIWLYEPKFCVESRLSGNVSGSEFETYSGIKRKKIKAGFNLHDKEYVPHETNLKSRLAWLSGLLDGDGCELQEGGAQLQSTDRTFLIELQKMLSTCGVNTKVTFGMPAEKRLLPDGQGGHKKYHCQETHRICIGASCIQRLKSLGLTCERLKFNKSPNRNASQYTKIVGIEEIGTEEYVYCFTEPKRNLGCFAGIVTGNCGEIALSSHDCCCLGHLVLPRFVIDGKVDWHLLAQTAKTGVRFLDNVLTVNHYPLPEMKAKSHKLRRIGLGTTGLADMLALLGYEYGSKDSIKFIDKLYRFISKASYEASVKLAIEKGPFPACKPSEHVKSGFMKRMTKKIKADVEEHGIRNCAILTQAPTGTVSILSGNCSSGIEPMFAAAYERRFWEGEERRTETVLHPLFKRFMDEGRDVRHFKSSRELSVRDHMEVQKTVQKHVDNAVSKTINIPENYPLEEVSKLWLEYLPYLKGTTFYRENTRGYVDENGVLHEPPLVALDLETAKKKYEEGSQEGAEIDCNSGSCDI
jgi:ribonucleoside-diphosphate reductase alpha chain